MYPGGKRSSAAASRHLNCTMSHLDLVYYGGYIYASPSYGQGYLTVLQQEDLIRSLAEETDKNDPWLCCLCLRDPIRARHDASGRHKDTRIGFEENRTSRTCANPIMCFDGDVK